MQGVRDAHAWSGVSHSSQGAQPPGFGAGIVRGWTYLEWSLRKFPTVGDDGMN